MGKRGTITGTMQIASYGVLGTPAIVVDGKVKSAGKIPTRDQISLEFGLDIVAAVIPAVSWNVC